MTLNQLFQSLISYIPATNMNMRKAYQPDKIISGVQYDIFSNTTNKNVAVFSVDNQGKLLYFSVEDEVLKRSNYTLKRDELIEKASHFVKTFYPEMYKNCKLASFLKLGNAYTVHFAYQDEQLHLFLPETGVTLFLTKSGKISTIISFHDKNTNIHYPDVMISAEAAKKQYLHHLEPELLIAPMDTYYINNNGKFRLVYSIIERAFYIPADGGEIYVQKDAIKQIPFHKPEKVKTNLHDIIGLKGYKLMKKKQAKNKRIEVWSTLPNVIQNKTDFDMEEIDPCLMKLCFDKQDRLLQITSEELPPKDISKPIGVDQAEEIAYQLLFYLYPEAHKQLIRIDGEGEIEDVYCFDFRWQYNSIRILHDIISIDVGKYSGRICSFDHQPLCKQRYEHVHTTPTLSKQTVKQIYADDVQMELRWFQDGESDYKLVYAPTFPKLAGVIRMIDAHTAQIFQTEKTELFC
ncbi:YcdB/YcdC domain-containing protein [Virgibacillus chiguensis]|uniref:YcdB/YcdC repeated domain-containing protein n=1 Tax=Virgibacillus chiguensis TaxID=411959 RepID=A0A1M5UN00_9BACI|nr:YcdB/YcdC domain-containing protein [Virgibacillus chiguensis]SHH64385.1 hypothetical protein SAMN05421807_11050 [Virgibacillus chiguensis]